MNPFVLKLVMLTFVVGITSLLSMNKEEIELIEHEVNTKKLPQKYRQAFKEALSHNDEEKISELHNMLQNDVRLSTEEKLNIIMNLSEGDNE